eukprot:TRINITY_DN1849_c0_g1_i2.p2 TRINITY_DN1849_c0_g1~~TRINITY_DN1849_c0_g1_i2.p2  ORF type:complete len:56 (-),score=26.09 TRINITY_DN1849_c0_g1_i2:2-169(-)
MEGKKKKEDNKMTRELGTHENPKGKGKPQQLLSKPKKKKYRLRGRSSETAKAHRG